MLSFLGFVMQWISRVAVLLLVSALLAEDQPRRQRSIGERAVQLLLRALDRLGLPVETLTDVLLGDDEDDAEEVGEESEITPPMFQTRQRSINRDKQREEERARVGLQGASLSFGDIRIVDSKYACYRITVSPSTGAQWEVWRRMADMIKLKAALGKVSAGDVDLPPLPHSYRRSFDASHLTRRRRRIQRFLQVVMAYPPLRDCEAFYDFLSPEFTGTTNPLARTMPLGDGSARRPAPLTDPQLSLNPTSGSILAANGASVGGDSPAQRYGSGSVANGGGGGDSDHGTSVRSAIRNDGGGDAVSSSPSYFPGEVADSGGGGGALGGGGGGDSSRSSGEDDPDGIPIGKEAGISGAGGGGGYDESGLAAGGMVPAWGAEGGGSTPPWSPLSISPRTSGRKSMDYMKNAVMTGTRRIARSVPMSMPNTKTIQRHIPMPKGVPKFPTKYNPYKRSATRRSGTNGNGNDNIDASTTSTNSSTTAAAADDGISMPVPGSPSESMSNSLSISAPAGLEREQQVVGAIAGAVGQHAYPSARAVPASAPSSPRRKSYLWKGKRGTSKTSTGISGAGVGVGGRGGEGGGGGTTRMNESAHGSAHGNMDVVGGGGRTEVGMEAEYSREEGVDTSNHPTLEVLDDVLLKDGAVRFEGAVEEGGDGGWGGGESRGDNGAGEGKGGGGWGFGGVVMPAVHLMPGFADGGEDHRFEVRGPQFATDGSKVRAGAAVCPLVYAELIADRRGPQSSKGAASPAPTAEATAAAMIGTGRIDHIATKGRCRSKIAELTVAAGKGAALEGGLGGSGGVEAGDIASSSPFLFIVNFQIPGDPPLSVVAVWAIQPEWLGPDSPDPVRRFFSLFYRFIDIPLSSHSSSSSSSTSSSSVPPPPPLPGLQNVPQNVPQHVPRTLPSSCPSSPSSSGDRNRSMSTSALLQPRQKRRQQPQEPTLSPPSPALDGAANMLGVPSTENTDQTDTSTVNVSGSKDAVSRGAEGDSGGKGRSGVEGGIGEEETGEKEEGDVVLSPLRGMQVSAAGSSYPWESSDSEVEVLELSQSGKGMREGAGLGAAVPGREDTDDDDGGMFSRSSRSRSRERDGGEGRVKGNGGDESLSSTLEGVLPPTDLRNRRLKLVTSLVKGPSVLRKAIPSGAALLGQKTNVRYFRGERYMEVDVDLASSLPASQLTLLCREHSKRLSLDLGLVLRGEEEHELPESVLGVLRIQRLNLQDPSRQKGLWEEA